MNHPQVPRRVTCTPPPPLHQSSSRAHEPSRMNQTTTLNQRGRVPTGTHQRVEDLSPRRGVVAPDDGHLDVGSDPTVCAIPLIAPTQFSRKMSAVGAIAQKGSVCLVNPPHKQGIRHGSQSEGGERLGYTPEHSVSCGQQQLGLPSTDFAKPCQEIDGTPNLSPQA